MNVKNPESDVGLKQLFDGSERFSRGHDLQNSAEIIIQAFLLY